ncbi:MAG: 16S rRNA processing protein RimM [Barnesiella sp.]|nr:16S rRNA processing protein RimM [Barnesiella sp.]
MITDNQITEIGRFNQPHGIKGELNALIDEGVALDELSCIVLDMDGIYVPFFMTGLRQRGAMLYLVSIDGITDEQKAATLANKTIYALADEVEQEEDTDGDDGFYAEDFIGFTIQSADGNLKGTITDIDDATDNVLFIVTTDNSDKKYLIPVADEFITAIDVDNRSLTVDLPEGLLEI